jgi:predicted membrane-bound spermidine synthase
MIPRHGLKLLITGLSAACGLVVEIAAGRMIAPYLGMSLYTWTAIISVVLAGFSVGHWIGGRLAGRPPEAAIRAVAWSLIAAAGSTALALVLIRVIAPATTELALAPVPTVLIVTGALFFLPSLFVGIPSPVLTKLAVDEASPTDAGTVIGAFYAIGAIGSIAGTLAAGFVFIAWLGVTATLILVAILYLAQGLALLLTAPRPSVNNLTLPLALITLSASALTFIGTRLEAFKEPCLIGSAYYCVRVFDVSRDHATPARVMVLDHLGHGINLRDHPRRLVSPYVELHDIFARIHSGRASPFRVFFIGGGAYTLPRAWADARPDAQLTVAEIDPFVTRTAIDELWLKTGDRITPVHRDARVALNQQSAKHFDVIVGDAFHDIVIPPHLVTAEFFALVASRLKADGIYLMNVVDNRNRPRLALSILKSMRNAFPEVEIWHSNDTGKRATYTLAGLRSPTPYANLPARASPGVRFTRIPPERLNALNARLDPIRLTDDYAPIDRLIGIN